MTAAAKKALDPAVPASPMGPDTSYWDGEKYVPAIPQHFDKKLQQWVKGPDVPPRFQMTFPPALAPTSPTGWRVEPSPSDVTARDIELHASQLAEDAEDLADMVALFKAHGISTKKATKLGKRILRKWKFGFHG